MACFRRSNVLGGPAARVGALSSRTPSVTWLDSQAPAALAREYEAGYRRKPEGRREIRAAEAAAARLLSTEDW